MSAHTPGPWTVKLTGMRGSFHIPEAQKHEAKAADVDDVDGYTVSSANARLIAAAPELLEALRYVMEDEINGIPRASSSCRRVVAAAIAKATGSQP